MNKEEVVKRLQELNYPISEYWLVAGAAMVLYGLRENTSDIDLGCTKVLADQLEKHGFSTSILEDGSRRISVAEDIEIFEDWLFDKIEIREDIPIISLKGLLEMKKSLGREKDQQDIRLIEKALQN